MRFFLFAALAALALASSYDAVVAESPNAVNKLEDNANTGFTRSLRSTTDAEERAIAELLDMEDRLAVNLRYRQWYKVGVTPTQAKVVLGMADETTVVARQLQRFYTGYFSFWTAMEKKKKKEEELEDPVKM